MAAPRTTIPELPEQTIVTETDEMVVQNGPITKRMTIGRLTTHGSQALTSHINDPSGAHQASSISAVPAGPPFTGADVQSQLSQGADSINQLLALINGHIAVAIDAHNASAISVIPVGNLSAVDVQAALVELQVAIDDLPVEPGGGGGITTEDAVDAIAVALQAGNNIDITYNDAANTILIAVETLTKDDVGLSNVNDTSDFNKPVSIAQQAALDTKQPLDTDLTTIAGLTATTDNVIQSAGSAWSSRTPAQLKSTLALTKADVGLGNVDNTSNANSAMPVTCNAAISPYAGAVPGGAFIFMKAGAYTDNVNASGQITLNFPTAFPNGLISFNVMPISGANYCAIAGRAAVTKSSVTFYLFNQAGLIGNGTPVDLAWQATGW